MNNILNKIRFKIIDRNTDLSKVDIQRMGWDVVINEKQYCVVKIDGFIHSLGPNDLINNYWAYPRNEIPSFENLVRFYNIKSPVNWGIKFEPKINITDCNDTNQFNKITITRNGKDFHSFFGPLGYGIDKARCLIEEVQEHPIRCNEFEFDKKVIGRKIWFESQPGYISRYINGEACVLIRFEKGYYQTPEEYLGDDIFNEKEEVIKASIFDDHIWWFRD